MQFGNRTVRIFNFAAFIRYVVSLTVAIYASLSFAETSGINSMKNRSTNTFSVGERVRINKNKPVKIGELILEVAYFSHKRPEVGGDTHAWADVKVLQNGLEEYLRLGVRGVEGKSMEEDGFTDETRYSKVVLNGVVITLVDFQYDKYIEVVVSSH